MQFVRNYYQTNIFKAIIVTIGSLYIAVMIFLFIQFQPEPSVFRKVDNGIAKHPAELNIQQQNKK